MATSPNYSWPEPDNTDLVKNGALAMRTLGNAIDTTMATMVPKSIVDAKGDLIAASAADTPARLAVGNNGETLVADSSASTGLRYQGNYAAGKNKILNGDFGIWQRGTSATLTSVNVYYADRWKVDTGTGNLAVSRQTFAAGQTDVAGNPNYFIRLAYANDTANIPIIEQRIEDVTTFAGQTVTFSFYGKVGSGTKSVTPRFVQDFGSGGSTGVLTSAAAVTFTTSWQRFTVTQAIPSITGKTIGTSSYLRLDLFVSQTSNLTYDISNVQLEAGSVATAFQTATGTIQGELAACQRYYYRWVTNGTSTAWAGTGMVYNSTTALAYVKLPQTMRVNPATFETTGTASDYRVLYTSGSIACSSVPVLDTSHYETPLVKFTVASGLTAGQANSIGANSTNAAYLGFSAEL